MSAVGRDVRRVGGRERVTGAQHYVADLTLPDMLHVRTVALDVARARLGAIDDRAARAIAGVVDVVSAADLPRPVPHFGPVFRDRPVLAVSEARYHGEPVCAVVAETRAAAVEAARLVAIEHEPLDAVTTIAAALAADAPRVQDAVESNVLSERQYGWGDVFEAPLVVDQRYAFPMVTHFAIEPHAVLARPDDGGIAVWSPVQHPYLLQRTLAEVLDLPLARVRVYAPDPGGGFGGKQNPRLEPLVALLALRTGRPCRLVSTLEETFQGVRRTACAVHARTGFDEDGTVVFQDLDLDYLLGAYADIAERVMTKSSYLACGPYRVPSARIRARAILSHTTPACAFRGFGTPQVAWAVEGQLNEAARRLGLDGLTIRRRNVARRGEVFVPGDVPADGDWPATLERAAELLAWDTPTPTGRGRGIALGIKAGATTGLSQALVRLLYDGSAIVYAGTSDMGQGARTIFAQIAADELGVAVDAISVVSGDTAIVPFDLQTSASRSTVFMGNAILAACADIRAQVAARAAAAGVATDGRALVDVTRDVLGRLRGEVIGTGEMRKDDMPEHPLGGSAAFFELNCTAFELEVDEETGEIAVHRHVTVGDVGRALNPLQVEMQDEGAAIMGLGHTLMEHVLLDDGGRIANLGALDYRIPTAKDLPGELVTGMIENADGPGPYGAKGVSEGAILCTAPALAAAVADATGAVIRELPLTPERVWRALGER